MGVLVFLLLVFLVLVPLWLGAPIGLAMWAQSSGRRAWRWFFVSTIATTALLAALGVVAACWLTGEGGATASRRTVLLTGR